MKSRVPDQNGISPACYIVEIYQSDPEPSNEADRKGREQHKDEEKKRRQKRKTKGEQSSKKKGEQREKSMKEGRKENVE